MLKKLSTENLLPQNVPTLDKQTNIFLRGRIFHMLRHKIFPSWTGKGSPTKSGHVKTDKKIITKEEKENIFILTLSQAGVFALPSTENIEISGNSPFFGVSGKLASLRHLKNEVESIKLEMECGVRLDDAIEPAPGDTLICYDLISVKQTLKWDLHF